MKKYEVFNTELNFIYDDIIRKSVIMLLNLLPDYFYSMPGSLSKFPHPDFAMGEGGLVRHTKAAVRIALELFRDSAFNTFEFSNHEKDLIIMALLLHDGFKQGVEARGYALFDHPLIAAKFVVDNSNIIPMDNFDSLRVSCMIASHMGAWNVDKTGKIVLPIPKKIDEIFVHQCDYLSSRKFIDIHFIDNEIVPSYDSVYHRVLKK